MAQAGYTPISLYYSTTSTQEPTAGNLVSGELAINIADGKLFYKNSAGNVRLLSIGYGSSSVTPTNGGVQYGTGTALALTAAGSSGQILRSNGAAAPTWADLSTLGVNTISFGTTGLTPNSATAGAVTVAGTLVTANGGTGLGGATPFTANGVLYASSASALTSGSALTFASSILTVNNTVSASNGTNTINVDSVNQQIASFVSGVGYGTLNLNGSPLVFQITGSEQMRLTSTGLGIGTSSPGVKLDIFEQRPNDNTRSTFRISVESAPGNQYAARIAAAKAVGGQPYMLVMGPADNNGHLAFTTGASDTERMRIDASGNLGLGVTPSAWSGGQAIQLGARGGLFYRTDLTSTELSANSYYNSGIGYVYQASAAAALYRQTSSQHQWFTAPSGTAGNAITFTQAMTLSNGGNLLVGTTTQAASSAGRIVSAEASGGGIQIAHNNSGGGALYVALGGGGVATYTYTGAVGSESYTERARITSGGALLAGGGLTAPLVASDFRASFTGEQGLSVQSTGGTGYYPLVTWNTATSGDNAFVAFGTEGAYTARGSITYNRAGGLVAYNTTSDYRAKDIIGPVQNPGATIDALKVYEGVMKGATQSRPMLIAHEAQVVAPYAVTGEKDAINENGEPIYQQMDVSSLVPLLLAEIQSLRQRVALLEGN